jgi:lysozyme family protein
MMAEPAEAVRFARCLDHVLAHEGGYVEHPRDPGGATNMGITHKTLARWRAVSPWWKLPKTAVRQLSRDEAASIYRRHYWLPARADVLPPGLDLALFDYAVNSGPARAIKALQVIVGVKADGLFGRLTLGAVRQRASADLIARLCDGRIGFLRRLASFATFGKGWTRRVASVRAAALAMAGASPLTTTERTTEMNLFAGYKTYGVAAIMLLVGLAGLFGLELPAFDGQAPATLVMEALAFIFLRKGLKNDLSNS